jgi:hypothetical protein
MNDLNGIQRFLQEINDHLQAGTTTDNRKAVAKLHRVALASTLTMAIRAASR